MKEREEEADGKAKENLILPSIGLLSKRQTDFLKNQLCHRLFFKSQKDIDFASISLACLQA